MKRTPVKPPTRDEAVETSEEGKRFQNSRNSRDEEDETVNRSGGWIIVDPPSSYDNAILALKALKCIEEKKPPLLDANFSPIDPEALNPDGRTALGIPTEISFKDGKQVVRFGSLRRKEEHTQYITFVTFKSRYGFNPYHGKLANSKKLAELPEECLKWREVINFLNNAPHDSSNSFEIVNEDAETYPGNTRPVNNGRSIQEDMSDIEPEKEKSPRLVSEREEISQTDQAENLTSWKRWITAAIGELGNVTFSGGPSAYGLKPIHSLDGEDDRRTLTQLAENRKVWEEEQLDFFDKGPSLRGHKDQEILSLLNSKRRSHRDFGKDILRIEELILNLWKRFYFTSNFIKNHLKVMRRSSSIQLDLKELCMLIPVYWEEWMRISETFKDLSSEWRKITHCHKTNCETLCHMNDMIKHIAGKRITSLKDAVGDYLSRAKTHIIPRQLSQLGVEVQIQEYEVSITSGDMESRLDISKRTWETESTRQPDMFDGPSDRGYREGASGRDSSFLPRFRSSHVPPRNGAGVEWDDDVSVRTRNLGVDRERNDDNVNLRASQGYPRRKTSPVRPVRHQAAGGPHQSNNRSENGYPDQDRRNFSDQYHNDGSRGNNQDRPMYRPYLRPPPREGSGGRDGDRRERRNSRRLDGGNRRPPDDTPSPPSSPSDRGGRRNFLPNNDRQKRTFVNDLARAIKGENDPYATDLLEGFNSLREMNNFYASLNIPWNVFPRVRGKKETILKEIQMALPEGKFFKGNPDDGTYFPWRVCVIQYIHRAALPITDKIQQITRCVTDDSDALKMEMQVSVFTPDTYKRMIDSLERMFGGEKRVYNYLHTQLFKGKPLDHRDPNSVQILRTKIDRFLEHCRDHHYLPAHEETMILDLVFQKLMTKYQVTLFREDISRNGINLRQPIQLDTLSSWLRDKEGTLEWVKMHLDSESWGTGRKNPRNTQKFGDAYLTENVVRDESEDSDEPQGKCGEAIALPTKPNKRYINRKDDKSIDKENKAFMTSAQSLETLTSIEDCLGNHSDFYDQETEMQQECLATQGKKFPTCSFCKKTGFDGRHMLYRCVEFIGLTPVKRLEQLKLMKRCFNCLSSGHSTLSECPSKFRCRECNKPHHTLLHFDLPSRKPAD